MAARHHPQRVHTANRRRQRFSKRSRNLPHRQDLIRARIRIQVRIRTPTLARPPHLLDPLTVLQARHDPPAHEEVATPPTPFRYPRLKTPPPTPPPTRLAAAPQILSLLTVQREIKLQLENTSPHRAPERSAGG